MPDFVAVLPVVHQPSGDACMASMSSTLRGQLLYLDNTKQNRGVSRSWNVGIEAMNGTKADWLVLISASVRFGEPGGDDFLASLDEPGLMVMEAMHEGWHLIAFHREVIERAGRFDENLYPGWFNDLDYGWRIAVAFGLTPPYWDKLPFDVRSTGWAHSTELAGIVCDPDASMAYLREKWGNVPGHGPTWDHPFNNDLFPVTWWPYPTVAYPT